MNTLVLEILSVFLIWSKEPQVSKYRHHVYIRIVCAPGTTDDYLHARFEPQSTAVPRTPCRVINRHIILQLQRLIRRFHALPAVGAATSGGWQRARKSEKEQKIARPRRKCRIVESVKRRKKGLAVAHVVVNSIHLACHFTFDRNLYSPALHPMSQPW